MVFWVAWSLQARPVNRTAGASTLLMVTKTPVLVVCDSDACQAYREPGLTPSDADGLKDRGEDARERKRVDLRGRLARRFGGGEDMVGGLWQRVGEWLAEDE